MSLTKKIDFALILKVTNANPNGDPLNGNRPRADFQGFGEMTDVCLKPKIRDRLQHYAFCPRQCALIHNEQAWAENYLTA